MLQDTVAGKYRKIAAVRISNLLASVWVVNLEGKGIEEERS